MQGNRTVIPTARKEGLVIQELPDEVLVYDLKRHQASCLNHTAARVWRHCDGKTSVAEVARRLEQESSPVDEQVVWYALDQLDKFNLLEERPQLPPEFASLSRRQFLRKTALAAAIAVPIIVAVVAPTPAQAASCLASGSVCTTHSQCCSGNCSNFSCS